MTTSSRTCPEAKAVDVDIRKLVPQRPPMLLTGRLEQAANDRAETSWTVGGDCYLLDGAGRLAETGLLEHMAQAASALAGWRARLAGAAEAPLGFIGEVKKFRCRRLPSVGEELRTKVILRAEAAGVLLVEAETRADGAWVADAQLKVAIRP